MKLSLKHLGAASLLSALLALPVSVQADHHGGKKVDPSGTWTWSRQGRDGTERTSTLKLKADGEKLMGTISGRNDTENKISNGKVNGEEISFDVSREFNGNSMTMKYTAKIAGDTLTGKWSITRDGQERSRDWTAKRAPALAGDWKSTIERSNGDSMELTLSFSVEAEKVTGKISVNEFEIPLEGTIKNGEVTYKTEMEREGTTWTSTFVGKLDGDKLTGKSTSKWNDQERTRDVVATRVK